MDSVVLETSLGDIQLELYWNHAPQVCVLLDHQLGQNNILFYTIDMQKLFRARKTRIL
jgi:hypothetical protein